MGDLEKDAATNDAVRSMRATGEADAHREGARFVQAEESADPEQQAEAAADLTDTDSQSVDGDEADREALVEQARNAPEPGE